MKISDFILLNGEEKKQAVLHEGVLVAKRKSPASIAFLFQVQNYYVEACFNAESKDVEEFRVFDHTTLLQPYLDEIPLDGLVN